MGQKLNRLPDHLREFAENQPLFFVASAANGRINLSPKGMDSLRFLSENQLIWLNMTGSGNETASHVLQNPRMTVMFCAFEGQALILRLYGQATLIKPDEARWAEWIDHFPKHPAQRQLFLLDFDLVTTSCGGGVPIMQFQETREHLVHDYFGGMSDDEIADYQSRKNSINLDGEATDIAASSGKF